MPKPDTQALNRLRQDQIIQAQLLGQDLTFHTTWGLFSPKAIDEGTELFLKHLPLEDQPQKILDLGCGYGPIGISLAKKFPQAQVVMVDKDFVAVDYAQKNATINQTPNVQVRLSNGFSAIKADEKFDWVLSNIPAKVGKELLTLFLVDAHDHLNPGGKLMVVTINGLRHYMKREFQAIFGNYAKLKQGKNYTLSLALRT